MTSFLRLNRKIKSRDQKIRIQHKILHKWHWSPAFTKKCLMKFDFLVFRLVWEEMPLFALFEGTVDDSIDDPQENQKSWAKTNRDIILLKIFLQTMGECRNGEEISPANVDEFLSEFIHTARRTKEGKDHTLFFINKNPFYKNHEALLLGILRIF